MNNNNSAELRSRLKAAEVILYRSLGLEWCAECKDYTSTDADFPKHQRMCGVCGTLVKHNKAL
jgi:hypothetical protein